jgi:hypothetical protein
MKKLIPLLFLGLLATLLPSCCALSKCGQTGKIVDVGCENKTYSMQEVTKYKVVKRMVYPGSKSGKGGVPYEVEDKIAYKEMVKVENECGTCGSIYYPNDSCCGVISPAVIKRATAQGGSGEPHIGTIPTMRVLAE